MLPTMHATAEELIESFEPGRADLAADYAIPFVQRVISAIIGFPLEDTQQIQQGTDDQNTLWNPFASLSEQQAAAERFVEYTTYMQCLIDDRRANPRDDLISDMVHGGNVYPGVPDEYTHTTVRGAARVAGFDTTRDAITSTVLAVLQNPDIRERVLTTKRR